MEGLHFLAGSHPGSIVVGAPFAQWVLLRGFRRGVWEADASKA